MKKLFIILFLGISLFNYGQRDIFNDENGIWIANNNVWAFAFNSWANKLFLNMAQSPDFQRKALISKTFDKLEAAGIIDTLDAFGFYNAHDVQASLLDWKTGTLSTPIGYPTFIIDSFWVGGGAQGINTNWIPSDDGVRYTDSDASIHVNKLTVGTTNRVIIGARNTSGNRSQINPDQTGGAVVMLLNNATLSIPSPTTNTGLYSMTLKSNSLKGYIDGNLEGSVGTGATASPDLAIYTLCYNVDGVINSSTSSKVNFWAAGGSLSPSTIEKLKDIVIYWEENMRSQSGVYVDLITGDGQSNMVGAAADTLKKPLLSAEIYDSTLGELKWIDGDNGGYQVQPTSGGNGFLNPIYATALNYEDSVKKIYFASYAISGSQLYEDASIYDWNANSTNEYLDNYLDMIDSCILKLAERGISVRNIYRVKFQGESDADVEVKANAFETNETALINKYNTRFNGYPIKHIIIEITDSRAYSSTVNGAINNIGASRSDTEVINNDDFTYTDGTHLDAKSMALLGKKIIAITY